MYIYSERLTRIRLIRKMFDKFALIMQYLNDRVMRRDPEELSRLRATGQEYSGSVTSQRHEDGECILIKVKKAEKQTRRAFILMMEINRQQSLPYRVTVLMSVRTNRAMM